MNNPDDVLDDDWLATKEVVPIFWLGPAFAVLSEQEIKETVMNKKLDALFVDETSNEDVAVTPKWFVDWAKKRCNTINKNTDTINKNTDTINGRVQAMATTRKRLTRVPELKRSSPRKKRAPRRRSVAPAAPIETPFVTKFPRWRRKRAQCI